MTERGSPKEGRTARDRFPAGAFFVRRMDFWAGAFVSGTAREAGGSGAKAAEATVEGVGRVGDWRVEGGSEGGVSDGGMTTASLDEAGMASGARVDVPATVGGMAVRNRMNTLVTVMSRSATIPMVRLARGGARAMTRRAGILVAAPTPGAGSKTAPDRLPA